MILDIKTFGREGGRKEVDRNFNEVELFNSDNELYLKTDIKNIYIYSKMTTFLLSAHT
jgi:hypothetical protein